MSTFLCASSKTYARHKSSLLDARCGTLLAKEGVKPGMAVEEVGATSLRPYVAGVDNEEEIADLQRLRQAL